MTTIAKLDHALETLAAAIDRAAPSAVTAELHGVLLCLALGDTGIALERIRKLGDDAERAGVAERMAPLFRGLLDAHSLAVVVALT